MKRTVHTYTCHFPGTLDIRAKHRVFFHLFTPFLFPDFAPNAESWDVKLMPEILLWRQKPLKIIGWQNTRLTPESSVCNAPAWHFIPCFISLYHTNPYAVYHFFLKCHELGVFNRTSLSFFHYFFLSFFFFFSCKTIEIVKGPRVELFYVSTKR